MLSEKGIINIVNTCTLFSPHLTSKIPGSDLFISIPFALSSTPHSNKKTPILQINPFKDNFFFLVNSKNKLSTVKKVIVGVCTFAVWGGGVLDTPNSEYSAKRYCGLLLFMKIFRINLRSKISFHDLVNNDRDSVSDSYATLNKQTD